MLLRKILLALGLCPFIAPLILAATSAWSVMDTIVVYSIVFFPTYIIGFILLIIGESLKGKEVRECQRAKEDVCTKKRIWIPIVLVVLVIVGVVFATGFPIPAIGRPTNGPLASGDVGMESFTGRTELRLSGWVYRTGGIYMGKSRFWTRRSPEDTAKRLTANYSDAEMESFGDGRWFLSVPTENGTDFYGLFEQGVYSGSKWALRSHQKYLLTDFLVSTYDRTQEETCYQLLPWILFREDTEKFEFAARAILDRDVKYYLMENAPEDLAAWLCDFYNATGFYRAEEKDSGVRVEPEWDSLTPQEQLNYYQGFFLEIGEDENGRWLMILAPTETPDNTNSWALPAHFYLDGKGYFYRGKLTYELPEGYEFIANIINVRNTSSFYRKDFEGNVDGKVYMNEAVSDTAYFSWEVWDEEVDGPAPFLKLELITTG